VCGDGRRRRTVSAPAAGSVVRAARQGCGSRLNVTRPHACRDVLGRLHAHQALGAVRADQYPHDAQLQDLVQLEMDLAATGVARRRVHSQSCRQAGRLSLNAATGSRAWSPRRLRSPSRAETCRRARPIGAVPPRRRSHGHIGAPCVERVTGFMRDPARLRLQSCAGVRLSGVEQLLHGADATAGRYRTAALDRQWSNLVLVEHGERIDRILPCSVRYAATVTSRMARPTRSRKTAVVVTTGGNDSAIKITSGSLGPSSAMSPAKRYSRSRASSSLMVSPRRDTNRACCPANSAALNSLVRAAYLAPASRPCPAPGPASTPL
jgi:hypothetical protein